MTDPTTIIPVGELIARRIDKHIIEPIFRFLRHRSPGTRSLLMLAALLLLVLTAVWFVWSLHSYSRLLAPTLSQRLEENSQPYRGVEALLLSAIRDEPNGFWTQGMTARQVEALGVDASGAPLAQPPLRYWSPDSTALWVQRDSTRAWVHPSPHAATSDSDLVRLFVTWGVRDSFKTAFLFVPGVLVPSMDPKDGAVIDDTPETIADRISHDASLVREVNQAEAIAGSLPSFDHATIDSLPIVQSYFIGDRGTFLIRDNKRQTGEAYASGFPARRYFADRPYFFNSTEPSRRLGAFDYVTEPYIDYAGYGVMRTYVKRFDFKDGHRGIVAFDCQIPNGSSLLRRRARDLRGPYGQRPFGHHGGDVEGFSLAIGSDNTLHESGTVPKWFREMATARAQKGKKEEVVGQISVSPGEGEHKSVLEFAVPLAKAVTGKDGLDWTEFVVVEVDPNDMLRVWIPGAVCLVCVGIFGAFAAFFFHIHISQPREQKAVLRMVERVMSDATTPFAWFDGQNRFMGANKAMAKCLGYDSVDELKFVWGGRRRTFRELLPPEEREVYARTLARSGRGEKTEPYWCYVNMRDGQKVRRVLAHGDRMPLMLQRMGEAPHRFGVFLVCDDPVRPGHGAPDAVPVRPVW